MADSVRTLEVLCPDCDRLFGCPLGDDEEPLAGLRLGVMCPHCETRLVIHISHEAEAKEGEIVIPTRIRDIGIGAQQLEEE